MKTGRDGAVLRHLGPLFEGQSVAGLGEVQLLERFVERRDEPAFAALVARHGPMVLGVCRRLLADPLDVEDAFQATFLVLVRRAGSLKDRDRLAPWLFGVARRVATRARANVARRKAREAPGVGDIAADAGLDNPTRDRELGRALVEEIDRLPGSLRGPILLCCVENLTYEEAATRLRSTAAAVRGRLARARGTLRDRLTRRGFAPGAAALGALLSAEAISAAVPSRLLTSTIQVAKAGTVPVGVEVLAQGVIRTMILTKSKILAVALVACGVAGSSMGLVAQDGPAPQATLVLPNGSSDGRPDGSGPKVDRLDQLEKKLDRVLQALEGRMALPTKPLATVKLPRSPFDLDPDSAVLPAAESLAPLPAPPPPPMPPERPQPRPQTQLRPGAGGRGPSSDGASPLASRVDALERKVRDLEATVDQLRQKLKDTFAGGGFD